ncbi:MAG: GIY-YIG nuclease family protein [Candidatus Omnitrophica bacterium]|nr:GIY-YIG nuclease family protein [Candidatus Omnitrophota bacterium]
MNNKSLNNFSKSQFFSIDILPEIPTVPGTYVLIFPKCFGRLKGKSNILYIGKSSKSLRQRLKFYFKPGPTQHTSKRINKFLKENKEIKISFITNNNPRVLEKKLLQNYFKDHDEYPPLNRNS